MATTNRTVYTHLIIFDEEPQKDYHHLEVVTVDNCGMSKEEAQLLKLNRHQRLMKRNLNFFGSADDRRARIHLHRIIAKVEKGKYNTHCDQRVKRAHVLHDSPECVNFTPHTYRTFSFQERLMRRWSKPPEP